MDTPLSPMEFLRRARKLYPERQAVVDEDVRLTYAEFATRCDRWSGALQSLGVSPGDRVAYIAPNTHTRLEGYYAVPQIGAVLVPINYRLTTDDFSYIINHSGAKVVCVDGEYAPANVGYDFRLGTCSLTRWASKSPSNRPGRNCNYRDEIDIVPRRVIVLQNAAALGVFAPVQASRHIPA